MISKALGAVDTTVTSCFSERASQQHQVLRETIQKYAPQATVDQVTLMLGVSGAIYNSTMEALKDKLGVTQPQLNTLLKKLHHTHGSHSI
jgi:hypothetical protein